VSASGGGTAVLRRISPLEDSNESSTETLLFAQLLLPCTIPVTDIVTLFHSVSGVLSPKKKSGSQSSSSSSSLQRATKFLQNRLYLQTTRFHTLEIDCLSANGHDILWAFLQASLAPSCIASLDPATLIESRNGPDMTSSTLFQQHMLKSSSSSVTTSVGNNLDIDTLQARHLQGRAAAETWIEKFSRRCGLVSTNVQVWWTTTNHDPTNDRTSSSSGQGPNNAFAWTGMVCCCSDSAPASHLPTATTTVTTSSTPGTKTMGLQLPSRLPSNATTTRRNVAPNQQLEIDDSTDGGASLTRPPPPPLPATSRPKKASLPPPSSPRSSQTLGRMLSGLSVEPDPDQPLYR
jgi:hypothetical protein